MSVDGVRLLGSQYRLSAQIGRGGMGEVWRGVDAQGRPRAFKLLLPHYAQDAEVVRRFLAERQVLTSVRDPNVVGVHDLVIEGSTLGIVMDLVEGQDLRHYLMERGTLSSGMACRIGVQVASGLAAIHAMRIVHRDVKPENILLDLRDDLPSARLTDFGVAKVLEETSVPSSDGGGWYAVLHGARSDQWADPVDAIGSVLARNRVVRDVVRGGAVRGIGEWPDDAGPSDDGSGASRGYRRPCVVVDFAVGAQICGPASVRCGDGCCSVVEFGRS